jgi:hypothetical protein
MNNFIITVDSIGACIARISRRVRFCKLFGLLLEDFGRPTDRGGEPDICSFTVKQSSISFLN